MTLVTTSFAQTAPLPQGPLTLTETKSLLRASLDREKLLTAQRNAALDHIINLDKQIIANNNLTTVDASALNNLLAQKGQYQIQVSELNSVIVKEREASMLLTTALSRAEVEVVRQKEKVKAANRRTLWGIIGGTAIGALVILVAKK